MKKITILTAALFVILSPTAKVLFSAENGVTSLETEEVLLSNRTGDVKRYSREELTKLLMPIGLYPSRILDHILKASTTPEDIVSANQFMKEAGPGLSALSDIKTKLKNKPWTESVKVLCRHESTLSEMASDLEHTGKLAEAFVNQSEDVKSVVLEIRARAHAPDYQWNRSSYAPIAKRRAHWDQQRPYWK
jgi:hypothetical protein